MGRIAQARSLAVAGVLFLLAGCGTGSASPPKPTATPASWTASTPPCPHSGGGACLGRLAGGLYRTLYFSPQITYRVPRGGWANDDDSPKSFLLVPPGYSVAGVDSGTSDFILVIPGVAASAKDCTFALATGSDQSPGATARWLVKKPGLATSRATRVTIGGPHGLVLDIRVKRSWHKMCPTSNPAGGGPATSILASTSSTFSWAVDPGSADRVYLLKSPTFTLGIMINDAKDAGHLDTYSRAVQSFQFKS